MPLSWLYGFSVSIRNRLYALGVLKARKLPCRVISVGNIAVGGTGKTPAVIAIAKHLQQKDVRVAILLRGYKRASWEQVTIVSDGERVCATLKESGDEAYMLASHLKGVPIVVGRQRYQAGRVALERFNAEVLLLDDGFQHRQLARDVDVLTVPAYSTAPEHLFRNRAKLLPAGTLREPVKALQRADVILLTHTDALDMLRDRKAVLQQLVPNALLLESVHHPVRLYPLFPKQNFDKLDLLSSAKALEGKRILAVCGIGNPDAFVATLRQYSPARVVLLAFPDHHIYTETDVTEIDTAFQTSRADLIVTTQKDEQKLVDLVADRERVIAVLEIALVITEGLEKFEEMLYPNIRT